MDEIEGEFGPNSKFLRAIHESYMKQLKSDFGPVKEPVPEDFGIDRSHVSAAQAAHAKNQQISIANAEQAAKRKKFNLYVPIIGHVMGVLVYPDKKMDPLGVRYANYLKKVDAYNEILKDMERERLIEIRKKEADYWFSLGGFEFEEEVAKLFRAHFGESSVIKTKGTGDGGIDLIITDCAGEKVFVQCKAHKQAVGPHVVRDLYGAMQSAGVTKGLLISLGGVTQGARDFVEGKEISIFDVNSIIKMQKLALESSVPQAS